MRYQRFVSIAREHWKKYRPKMYRALEQSEKLDGALEQAAERTIDECIASIQAGMDPWEAESEAIRANLLLPCEEDQPDLGVDPDRLPDPASLVTDPGVLKRPSVQPCRRQNRTRVN